jgi:hypothetical protein
MFMSMENYKELCVLFSMDNTIIAKKSHHILYSYLQGLFLPIYFKQNLI